MAIKFSGDLEIAGFIPSWIFEEVTKSAVEQIDMHYGHGGGWHDTDGFIMADDGSNALIYPGDPRLEVRSRGWLRDERILIYDHGWVAVMQSDDTFRVARID